MAAVSSIGGAQAAIQAAMQQLKVRQAKQNAERAEYVARALRAEADAAQRKADSAQEEARRLYLRSDQAQDAAGRARQGLAMIESAKNMGTRLANVAGRASEWQVQPQQIDSSAPVVNVSGQVTGTLINTVV